MRAVLVALLLVATGCGKLFGVDHIPYAGDAAIDYFDAPPDAPPAPQLQLSVSSYDFGNVVQHKSSFPIIIDVTNVGDAASGLLGISKTGSGGDFAVAMDSCTGLALAPGHQCSFQVAFAPQNTGMLGAMIAVTDQVTSASASFSGTSLVPGALDMSPSPANLGTQDVGSSIGAATITLKNTGGSSLTLVSVGLSGDTGNFMLVANPACKAGTVLANNGTCTIDVHFMPVLGGSHAASLDVTTDAMTNPMASAAVGGIGRSTITVMRTGNGRITSSDMPPSLDCGATCSAQFTSAQVVLSQVPDPQNAFKMWSANCQNPGMTCTIPTNAATIPVTATFVPYAKLTVNVTGTAGRVTAPGLDCTNAGGATCMTSYPPGTNVVLTPMDQGTSLFSVWTGACQGQDLNSTSYAPACHLTITNDVTVDADFITGYVLNLVPAATNYMDPMAKIANTHDASLCVSGQVCSIKISGTSQPSAIRITPQNGMCTSFGGWTGGGCTGILACNVSFPTHVVTVDYDFNFFSGTGCLAATE